MLAPTFHFLAASSLPVTLAPSHWAHDMWLIAQDLFGQHLRIFVGFVLALLVVGRLMLEKRNPSNVYAWGLIIFFVPWLGVPLYFLFGGRKSRRLVKLKLEVNDYATHLAAGISASSPLGFSTNSPVSPRRRFAHNSFRLFGDGVENYRALRAEIARAEESIDLQTFILGRDEPARQIVADLADRARAGVEVKLLLDALGCLGACGSFVEPLRQAGGRTARFMPVLPLQTKTSANLRNHRKFAIFDGDRAIVGGQNIDHRFIASRDSPELFLDFSAQIEGPVVAAFNRNFVSDWCFASRDSPKQFQELLAHIPAERGVEATEVLASGPDVSGDPLWERLLILAQQCRRELTIVTPYFIPDEVLFRSLIVQAHCGRHIRIVVPENSNHIMADFARHFYLRQLHDAGVEVLLYRPKMMHAKLVLMDGEVALMGSANMDMRSLFVNFEIGVFLYTPEPIRELTAWTDRLRHDCVTYLDSGHAGAGANRRLMEDFAHLLGPLM
jgi:cardiolipin synthase A/B